MFPEEGPPCQELRQNSPPFEVSHPSCSTIQRVPSLSLFEHRILCNDNVGVMYAGGHISALNFHPSSPTLCALAAHRQDQSKHNILKCYKGRAHIQLWNIALRSNQTHCVGILQHNGNCTWDLKWRPTNADTSNRIVGTLAAALGDGTAIVATFEDHNFPNFSAKHKSSPPTEICTLNPKVMSLRGHKKPHQRSPVRVAEWSPDGARLVLGIANGTIEVYEASSEDTVWPRWCLPAQETVITGLQWMDANFFCSISISCVLRLRDMRDPVSSLEQNEESLAASFGLTAIEPTVAVVATDGGNLRIIKLQTIDGVAVKEPMKRIYLQSSTLRDVQSVKVTSDSNSIPCSLLYTGGSEGIIDECIIPRPVWPSAETCHLARTETAQKMRWTVNPKTPSSPSTPENNESHSQINAEDTSQDESTLHLSIQGADLEGKGRGYNKKANIAASENKVTPQAKKSKKYRRSRAPGREGLERDSNVPKTVLFGSELNLRTAITKISVAQQADLVLVGIEDGLLTWIPMKNGEDKTHYLPNYKAGPGRPKKNKELTSQKRVRAEGNRTAKKITYEEISDDELEDDIKEENMLEEEMLEDEMIKTDEEDEDEEEDEESEMVLDDTDDDEPATPKVSSKSKKPSYKNALRSSKTKTKDTQAPEQAEEEKEDVTSENVDKDTAEPEEGAEVSSRRSRRLYARKAKAKAVQANGSGGKRKGAAASDDKDRDAPGANTEVNGTTKKNAQVKKKKSVSLRSRVNGKDQVQEEDKAGSELDNLGELAGVEESDGIEPVQDVKLKLRLKKTSSKLKKSEEEKNRNSKVSLRLRLKREREGRSNDEVEQESNGKAVGEVRAQTKKRKSVESEPATSTTASTPSTQEQDEDEDEKDSSSPRRPCRARKPSWRVKRG